MRTTTRPVPKVLAPPPTSAPPTRGRRSGWRRAGFGLFTLGCVVVAVTAPWPYLTQSLDTLAASDSGLAAHWAAQPHWVYVALLVHASASGLAILLTPWQLSARARRRWPALHRATGRVTAAAIMVGGGAGLVIATHSYAGALGTAGFGTLAVLWVVGTVQAVRLAARGDLAGHRRWAVRVAALTFAAVTLRLGTAAGTVLQFPADTAQARTAFDHVYRWMPFGCWVPNLALAEWTLRRRRPAPIC